MFCSPSGGLGLPYGRLSSARVTNNILSKIFPENSETTLAYSSPGAGWSRGGSSCFSFCSNMEMLSSPDLTVRIKAELETGALSSSAQDKQG